MRASSWVSGFFALFFIVACGETGPRTPQVLKRLGNACETNDECGSGDCRHGACTRDCSAQGDCPWGLDCGVQGSDAIPSCFVPLYAQPTHGGFNTSCALYAGDCGAGANPCAQGFVCVGAWGRDRADAYQPIQCDPEAFCTATCANDTDCPPTMFCGTDRANPSDKDDDRKVCLPRTQCTPCVTDDQCPFASHCVLGEDGARFCAKTCAQPADCLKPQKDGETGEAMFEPFEVCAPDRGDASRTVCQPVAGRCHGKSAIDSQPSGGICAPCRKSHPEDCGEGYGCIESPQGERFCSTNCEITLSRSSDGRYGIKSDTCPEGTHCYLGGYVPRDCGAQCTIPSVCNADPTYMGLTCMPVVAED